MILYRFLQVVTGILEAVLLYFFVIGLGDGSIDASNMLLWIVLLGIPAGAFLLARASWSRGRRGVACMLLALPAVPALLYGAFVLLIVVAHPDFR